ncbi:hypothetical protein GGS21DRAFT_501366 [Xylaria nigripes]|nr:hypothetical protein GGS21DRAFT_501366 [Xylaria nigripes]
MVARFLCWVCGKVFIHDEIVAGVNWFALLTSIVNVRVASSQAASTKFRYRSLAAFFSCDHTSTGWVRTGEIQQSLLETLHMLTASPTSVGTPSPGLALRPSGLVTPHRFLSTLNRKKRAPKKKSPRTSYMRFGQIESPVCLGSSRSCIFVSWCTIGDRPRRNSAGCSAFASRAVDLKSGHKSQINGIAFINHAHALVVWVCFLVSMQRRTRRMQGHVIDG